MTELDLTQPIALESGSYAYVQRGGNNIRLRHLVSGAILDTTMAELARAGVGRDAIPERSVRALESVAAKAEETARQLAEHLREIETGVRSDGRGGEVRCPEYDPRTTTQEQRIQHKIEELLTHHGIEKSRATLMRDLGKYRKHGAAGLIDGRALRRWGPLDGVDERVVEALTEVMASQKNRSTGTRSRIIVEVKALLLRRHGPGGPSMPSNTSMYRYIDMLDGGRHTTGLATTRRSRGDRPNRTFADTSRLIPGAEVQVDTHTLDLEITTASGPTRPYLTIMLDVASRSVLSWTLRLEATKGVDHVVLLASALVPPELRPDRTAHREIVRSRRPDLQLRSAAELEEARRHRPYVYPRMVMMDNGKDYKSEVFLSALAKFHIDARFSAPHTPVDKSKVERTFRSIETLLIQHLPGYIGNSPHNRGRGTLREKGLLDFWALYEVLEDWFLFEWQNRPHRGLRDRLDPSIQYTPNQLIARAQELTSTLRIPMTPADYIDMMPKDFRAIGDSGVQMGNRHYDDEALHSIRHTRSNYPNKNGAWKVAYDPYNSTLIWVEGRDGEWIRCQARNLHLSSQPYEGELAPTPESERAAVARLGSEQAGVPAHVPPVQPRAVRPTDFDDDFADLEPLPEFNPDEEY